jgi:hypothetical protein
VREKERGKKRRKRKTDSKNLQITTEQAFYRKSGLQDRLQTNLFYKNRLLQVVLSPCSRVDGGCDRVYGGLGLRDLQTKVIKLFRTVTYASV